MTPNPKALLAGIITLGAFIAAVVFGFNSTHGMPLAQRTVVAAAFDDVGGLAVGDDVRIASVRVGYVNALRMEDGHAVAELKIDDNSIPVYADATAAVVDRSALGQKFVNLDPGTSGSGELTETIPVTSTRKAEDINQLLDSFDEPTRAATGTTLREVGGGASGHAEDMNEFLDAAPGVLKDTAKVAGALSVDDGDALADLLASSDQLSSRFAGREEHVADLLRQLGTTLEAFNVDEDEPLKQSIDRAPETLDALTSALRTLDQPLADTASAMTALRPGAEALGAATPDLRGFLRDAVDPLRKVPGVSRKAVPAVESLTDLVKDARPLTRQLVETGDGAATPLSVFAPYTDEIMSYFILGKDTLKYDTAGGKYARILVLPGLDSLGGGTSTDGRNPYPDPGEGATDTTAGGQ